MSTEDTQETNENPLVTRWRRILREVGRTSAAVALVASTACGSSHGPSGMDAGTDGRVEAGPEEMDCRDVAPWDPFADFVPEPGVDYVAVGQVGAEATTEVLGRWGTPCTGAAERTACEEQVRAREASGSLDDGRRWVLWTDAMGVHVADAADPVALQPVLGTVDSEQEALFRLWIAGYRVDCRATVVAVDGGYEATLKELGCGTIDEEPGWLDVQYRVERDGTITELTLVACGAGRFPQHLLPVAPEELAARRGDPLGVWFAATARVEAAAVTAFEELAEELRHHGAPEELVVWAERSAEEEVEHARLVGRLARRYGVEPLPARSAAGQVRSLEAIALDNAVEGLVRETYGAAVAHHQAAAAEDPAVRQVMEVVAEDESRHAAFSWALHAWLLERLDPAARARVERAVDEAVARFEQAAGRPVDARLQRLAGLPGPEASQRILAELRARVWN